MQKPLPFIISIPHGGTETPLELRNLSVITLTDLFDDSDAFTQQIYDVKNATLAVVKTPIARAFIDLNRPIDALPPEYPDGIVKSMTCYRKPVYKSQIYLDTLLVNKLIENYYYPYHHKMEKLVAQSGAIFVFDCHSMTATAPPISPDSGEKRPLINLGNNFGKSASSKDTTLFAACLSDSFGIEKSQISINKPFAGGYITKKYGNNPIPCIQIEMNRSLYLSTPWFNSNTLQINKDRLIDLNQKFFKALTKFYNEINL